MAIRQFYEANAYASCVLSIPLNLLLLFMIVKHTPTAMRTYSLILIQTCSADLALICVQTIVQPVNFLFTCYYEFMSQACLSEKPKKIKFSWYLSNQMGHTRE